MNRIFYLLENLEIKPYAEDDSLTEVSFVTTKYYFEDPMYEAQEDEIWLAEKMKELGLTDLETAEAVIKSGKIAELKGDCRYTTTMLVSTKDSSYKFLRNISEWIE